MADQTKSRDNAAVIFCLYCEKKVVTKVTCNSCGASFHRSCQTRKKCCESPDIKEDKQENVSESEDEVNKQSLLEQLKQENLLLRQMTKELSENNEFLRRQIEGRQHYSPNPDELKLFIKTECEKYLKSINSEIQTTFKSPYQVHNEKHKGAKQSEQSNNHQQLITKQKEVISKLNKLGDLQPKPRSSNVNKLNVSNVDRQNVNKQEINIKCSETQPDANLETIDNTSNHGEFTEVKRKRKTTRKNLNLGTHEIEKNSNEPTFEARSHKEIENKKLWLFVSRAKDHVSTELVASHIAHQGKINISDVTVKQLDTRKTTIDNKCFMVGVPYNLQEVIYKNEFWPKGISYGRFNFRQGRHFLDQNSQRKAQQMEEQ